MKIVKANDLSIELLDEFKKSFNGEHIYGADSINEITIEEWINSNKIHENLKTLPTGRVLAHQYVLFDEINQKIIGCIQLRFALNDFLSKYAGHIGYSVRPDERRKGYAKLMLEEILKIAKSNSLTKVLITCLETNIGSAKTIESCGGIFESKIHKPDENVILNRYWIDLTDK